MQILEFLLQMTGKDIMRLPPVVLLTFCSKLNYLHESIFICHRIGQCSLLVARQSGKLGSLCHVCSPFSHLSGSSRP